MAEDYGAKFLNTVRPIVLDEWQSERFKSSDDPIQTAAKLVNAVALLTKYPTEEVELWDTVV